jgi:enamine deaminase RidA (YjgF/YER057c/UK114 family)
MSPAPELPSPVAVPRWSRPHGYSDAMHGEGRILVTAGIIGWNPETQEIETDNFASQAAQVFRNIRDVLAAAQAAPEHLVRLTWYITNRDEYVAARPAIGLAWREVFDRHYPAMAVVIVSGLIEPRAKIEIEATAVVPR